MFKERLWPLLHEAGGKASVDTILKIANEVKKKEKKGKSWSPMNTSAALAKLVRAQLVGGLHVFQKYFTMIWSSQIY